MYANRRNFRVLKEIGVEEHDRDVRFKSRSRNVAVSCMRNAFGYKYRNSLFIVDLAMGQIPRSTERISSIYDVDSRVVSKVQSWLNFVVICCFIV